MNVHHAVITLVGCDDETEIHLRVSDVEFEFLKKLQDETTLYGGGCKPRLEVRVVGGEP